MEDYTMESPDNLVKRRLTQYRKPDIPKTPIATEGFKAFNNSNIKVPKGKNTATKMTEIDRSSQSTSKQMT